MKNSTLLEKIKAMLSNEIKLEPFFIVKIKIIIWNH